MPARAALIEDHDTARPSRRQRSAMMQRVRQPAVDVTMFAVVKARLDAGYPKSIVLDPMGLDDGQWQGIEQFYTATLAYEARNGQNAHGRRYAAAYAEEWAKHAPTFAATRSSAPPPESIAPTPRLGRSVAPTLVSPTQPQAPEASRRRRTQSGTIAIDVRSSPQPFPAARPSAPPPPASGTVVMAIPQRPSEAEPPVVATGIELHHYVQVSAALAASTDRRATLARYRLTLQQWVDWSARMGNILASDGALRARYSKLLHEAIRKTDAR